VDGEATIGGPLVDDTGATGTAPLRGGRGRRSRCSPTDAEPSRTTSVEVPVRTGADRLC